MMNEKMQIGVILPEPSIAITRGNAFNRPIAYWSKPIPPANEYS
jgi:hypothetical protein